MIFCQFVGALGERDELKRQLEATPTSATPTPEGDDVAALREMVSELQMKLLEKETGSSTADLDMEKELEEKSVRERVDREGGRN